MQSLILWFRWFFSATLPAGRVLGIPLRVHLALVLLLPFFAWALIIPAFGILFNLLYAGLYIGILYASVLAHELGHAWGCRLVGGKTEQIILTPVGGLHLGTGGIESPRTELIVVALGPAVSVILALIGSGAWFFVSRIDPANQWVWLATSSVLIFGAINTMLAVFNLLFPLFPMDSARLIRALFSLRYRPELVTMRVCRGGIVLAIVVMIIGLFGVPVPFLGRIGVWLMLIALLAIQGCLMEMERMKHMGVYTCSDDWGRGPVYYDKDLVGRAKGLWKEDLRGLFRRKRRSVVRRSKPVGPAKVIDLATSKDPAEVTDLEELKQMMRAAAQAEDFQRAARIKRRLRELENSR